MKKWLSNNKKLKKYLLNTYIKLHNYSYHKISQIILVLNDNIHPKHRIMNYHKFFIDNIANNDTVLDIGCGNGFLTYDLAEKAKEIVGIDINSDKIAFAVKKFHKKNIKFLHGDATQCQFAQKFDKIVLSNVLEHISERVTFLKNLHKLSNTLLLRVPMLDRDWLTIYKKENGFDYKLDPSHYIEYTLEDLKEEVKQSGWKIKTYSIQFGEFWGIIIE